MCDNVAEIKLNIFGRVRPEYRTYVDADLQYQMKLF